MNRKSHRCVEKYFEISSEYTNFVTAHQDKHLLQDVSCGEITSPRRFGRDVSPAESDGTALLSILTRKGR